MYFEGTAKRVWDKRSGVGDDCTALEDRAGTHGEEHVRDGLQTRKPVLPQTIFWVSTQTQAHGFGSKGPKLILQKPGVNAYARLHWSLRWLLDLPSDQNKDPRTPKLKFFLGSGRGATTVNRARSAAKASGRDCG